MPFTAFVPYAVYDHHTEHYDLMNPTEIHYYRTRETEIVWQSYGENAQ